MNRRLFAIIEVDDEVAFATGSSPVPYLEEALEPFKERGVVLSNCFIADEDEECDDESACWSSYIDYIIKWAFDHRGEEFSKMSPSCYDEFITTKMLGGFLR